MKKTLTANSKTAKIIFHYVIPIILVCAIVLLGIWGNAQKTSAENYRMAAMSIYEQAYTDLVTNIYDMNVALKKLSIAKSTVNTAYILDDIWRISELSTVLLGQIPESHVGNSEINRLILRIGDYARSLSIKCMKGTPLSDDDREQLKLIQIACNTAYSEVQSKLSSGLFPSEAIDGESFYSSNTTLDADGNEIHETAAEGEEKYPTLIYDGPFSESTEKQTPLGLGGENIDESTALMKAYEYVGDSNTELKLSSLSDGKIKSYDFYGRLSDGRSIDISISVQGGYLVWMRIDPTSDIEGLPLKDEESKLISTGKEWLSELGFTSMEPTYAQYYAGTALINFAFENNDVIFYNDLVKVYIDRETMSICGIDARNYLFSHAERDLEAPDITLEEAESYISDDIEILETNIALIPATAQTEVLCYEFKCSNGDDDFIVYIDVRNGDEVKILMIIYDEHGQLVI